MVDMEGVGTVLRIIRGEEEGSEGDSDGEIEKYLKGNEPSSKTTCLDMYILFVIKSRHL
jgi:hypothetical protein